MTSGVRNSAGQDTDDLYAPDTVGDGPTAPGFRRSDGTTLKYAAAKYGTPGASMGFRLSNGVDIGPQWARKSTASYAIAVDGQTYTEAYSVPAQATAAVSLIFGIIGGGSTWQVSGGSPAGNTVFASGSVPAGAATVKYTWGASTTPASYATAGGTTTNGAASATALSTSPSAKFTSGTFGSSAGSRRTSTPLTIDFYNSSGTSISHSVCTLVADVEGSV